MARLQIFGYEDHRRLAPDQVRGLDRVRMAFTFALAAYNLISLPKLAVKTT